MANFAVAVVAVSIVLEQAAALAQQAGGGGGGGANWYLRAPDGSSQGPYGLSQLGEWSSSGYVSLGESVCESNKMMQHDMTMTDRRKCLNPPSCCPARWLPTCSCVSNAWLRVNDWRV